MFLYIHSSVCFFYRSNSSYCVCNASCFIFCGVSREGIQNCGWTTFFPSLHKSALIHIDRILYNIFYLSNYLLTTLFSRFPIFTHFFIQFYFVRHLDHRINTQLYLLTFHLFFHKAELWCARLNVWNKKIDKTYRCLSTYVRYVCFCRY